jgi:hypothetical protein
MQISFPPYLSELKLNPSVINRVEIYLNRFTKLPFFVEVSDLISNNIPSSWFHNIRHSETVLWFAVFLSLSEGVDDQDTEINAISALYHDIGFVDQIYGKDEGHEVAGADYAAKSLSQYGYHKQIVDEVCCRIKDTTLYRSAANSSKTTAAIPIAEQRRIFSEASRVLMDADLHNLGTSAFEDHLIRLYNERNRSSVRAYADLIHTKNGVDYLAATLAFLKHHTWQGDLAKRYLDVRKQKNIQEIERLLSKRSNR